MRLDIFCILLTGYFIHASAAAKKDKNAQVKAQQPEMFEKQHSHQYSISYESPTEHYENEYSYPTGGKNDHIVVHSHQYNPEDGYDHQTKYVYNPEKKHKSKQKKSGKKKSKKPKKKKYGDDQDFKKILSNYDSKPEKDDDGGFKTTVHTEHYEVKKINPNARFPDEKYIIQGAYKVQETDPWGKPVTSFHEYDSPVSKIAASILSKYDYTNFRPGESDDYNKEKEEENNHYDNPSGYRKPKQNDYYTYEVIPSGKNNERDYEKSAGYEGFVKEKNEKYKSPFDYVPVQPTHDDVHSKQNYGNNNQRSQDYTIPQVYGNFKTDDSKRVEHLKKMPEQVEYIAPHDHDSVQRELEYEFEKEFGHLVYPGHTASDHYDHDSEYEKYLIDYIYGPNHAASTKFVQKVKPQKRSV